jgi:hypothetical protein
LTIRQQYVSALPLGARPLRAFLRRFGHALQFFGTRMDALGDLP